MLPRVSQSGIQYTAGAGSRSCSWWLRTAVLRRLARESAPRWSGHVNLRPPRTSHTTLNDVRSREPESGKAGKRSLHTRVLLAAAASWPAFAPCTLPKTARRLHSAFIELTEKSAVPSRYTAYSIQHTASTSAPAPAPAPAQKASIPPLRPTISPCLPTVAFQRRG